MLDTKTNLVWRRCAEGMKWDGKICGGKPVKYKLSEAKGVAAGAAKASGQAWRIPNRDDLTLFLTLSIPIFVTTVTLLSFIVIFGSVAAKH